MATPSSITIPERLLTRLAAPARAPGKPVMTGEREENDIEADDPDVEIHEAILARDRAGGPCPDADAMAAMREPLHRLTSAAVLFSDVTAKNTEGPELFTRPCSPGGPDQ